MQATKVFHKNCDVTGKRYILNQGGTRSGKTVSLMQVAYFLAYNNKDKPITISVASETMPHLRRGAMKDFFDFLNREKIYSPSSFNITNNIYKVGKAKIEFFSVDSPDKVHGPSRDYLFCNEIQNWKYETFFHLAQRTAISIYADWNPTHEFFIYPEFINNKQYSPDLALIKSTIFDNDYCPENIKKDVLLRAERDANYKRVYLDGEIGSIEGLVYPNFHLCDSIPQSVRNISYGLDFGFNHPTVLVKIGIDNNAKRVYVQELCYLSEMLNSDISQALAGAGIRKRSDEIFADSARPDSIEELYRMGWNIKGVGAKHVVDEINMIKEYDLFVTKDSLNGIKELRSYSWKTDKNGMILNEPVKFQDDFVDAMRYGIIPKIRNGYKLSFI